MAAFLCVERFDGYGQTWCAKAGAQLFCGSAEAEFIAPGRSDLPGGPQEAADLVRRHLFRTKERTQFNTHLTTRFRGSGGPLPPFSNFFKLEAIDMGHEMTPVGVFFPGLIPISRLYETTLSTAPKCAKLP